MCIILRRYSYFNSENKYSHLNIFIFIYFNLITIKHIMDGFHILINVKHKFVVKSELVFKLFPIDKLSFHFPYRIIIGDSWELFRSITHDLFCNKFLYFSLHIKVFAFGCCKMATH